MSLLIAFAIDVGYQAFYKIIVLARGRIFFSLLLSRNVTYLNQTNRFTFLRVFFFKYGDRFFVFASRPAHGS